MSATMLDLDSLEGSEITAGDLLVFVGPCTCVHSKHDHDDYSCEDFDCECQAHWENQTQEPEQVQAAEQSITCEQVG